MSSLDIIPVAILSIFTLYLPGWWARDKLVTPEYPPRPQRGASAFFDQYTANGTARQGCILPTAALLFYFSLPGIVRPSSRNAKKFYALYFSAWWQLVL